MIVFMVNSTFDMQQLFLVAFVLLDGIFRLIQNGKC